MQLFGYYSDSLWLEYLSVGLVCYIYLELVFVSKSLAMGLTLVTFDSR